MVRVSLALAIPRGRTHVMQRITDDQRRKTDRGGRIDGTDQVRSFMTLLPCSFSFPQSSSHGHVGDR